MRVLFLRSGAFDRAALWDRLAAVPLVAWTAVSLQRQVPALAAFLSAGAGRDGAVFYAAAGAKAASILFLAFLLLLLLTRRPPIEKSRGAFPRLAALAGTYLGVAVMLLPPRSLGWGAELATALFVLAGTLVSLYAIAGLGRSISLMPEARRLVTGGPYRLMRHPLYFGEALMLLGIALQHVSWRALVIVALQFAFQLKRMECEERVLASSFPDYAAYRARTARLVPYVY